MSVRIAIISAMHREVAPLLKSWERRILRHDRRSFAMWTKDNCTYVQSGVGRNPALAASRAAWDYATPDIFVSAGFAGALTGTLRVGDVVIPATVIDGLTGRTFACAGGSGVLVSASAIADEATKRKLASQFGADTVDMEAAAVAQVADEHSVRFSALKAISDELGFAMPPFNSYVREDGSMAMDRFAAHVAVRPSYWPSLVHLARNSKKASLELSSALEHLVRRVSEMSELEKAVRTLGTSARAVN